MTRYGWRWWIITTLNTNPYLWPDETVKRPAIFPSVTDYISRTKGINFMKRQLVRVSSRHWRAILQCKRAIDSVRAFSSADDWNDWAARRVAIHLLSHLPRRQSACPTCPPEAKAILGRIAARG